MIGATSGALTFDAAPNFEDPQDQDAGNTRVERGRRLVRAPMLRVGRLAAAFLLAAAAVPPVAPVAAQDVAPAMPTGFAVAPGSIKAKLSWSDPPAGITRHEVRFRAGAAAFPSNWARIPDSGSAAANRSGYILSGLTADTDYDFEFRAVNGAGDGTAAAASATTLPPFTAQFTSENKYHDGDPFTIEVEFSVGVEKEVLERGATYQNANVVDVAEQDGRPELWHFVPHPRSRTRPVTIVFTLHLVSFQGVRSRQQNHQIQTNERVYPTLTTQSGYLGREGGFFSVPSRVGSLSPVGVGPWVRMRRRKLPYAIPRRTKGRRWRPPVARREAPPHGRETRWRSMTTPREFTPL